MGKNVEATILDWDYVGKMGSYRGYRGYIGIIAFRDFGFRGIVQRRDTIRFFRDLELNILGLRNTYSWLAGYEGTEKNMENTVMGYIGTTI